MTKPKEQKFYMEREREKPEFEQKILDIRRVARVVAGGRRFSFRVTAVIGNKKGKVGVAVAKGADVALAMEKAASQARKNLMQIELTPEGSILHEVYGKSSSAIVVLKPASRGHGLIAGGALRVVLGLLGVKNISSKILSRSANKLNNARATLDALRHLRPSRTNPK